MYAYRYHLEIVITDEDNPQSPPREMGPPPSPLATISRDFPLTLFRLSGLPLFSLYFLGYVRFAFDPDGGRPTLETALLLINLFWTRIQSITHIPGKARILKTVCIYCPYCEGGTAIREVSHASFVNSLTRTPGTPRAHVRLHRLKFFSYIDTDWSKTKNYLRFDRVSSSMMRVRTY